MRTIKLVKIKIKTMNNAMAGTDQVYGVHPERCPAHQQLPERDLEDDALGQVCQ